MDKAELQLRRDIVAACRSMNAMGINQGTSGNISARYGDHMLITPSGVPYDEMDPKDIVPMPLKGPYGSYEGDLVPSSEWRFHLDIMLARPEVGCRVYMPPATGAKPAGQPLWRADDALIAEWRQRMGTPEAAQIYRQRAATIECVNALARNRGLQRFLMRGLRRVRSAVLWFALAHNLMRTVTLGRLQPAAARAAKPMAAV